MRMNKKFTNTNFTKRVDHVAGAHRQPRSLREPSVCSDCDAICRNRRWVAASEATVEDVAVKTICPACKQSRSGEPRGFVFLDGTYFSNHQDEIEKLLRNEAERAAEDNVLARIIDWTTGEGHKLTLTTTTEHLAQRLGHALHKAFHGKVNYDFSHENKLVRVNWLRD